MRCGYFLLALAACLLQLSLAASLPVRPSASVIVEARCPRMECRIAEPASAVTATPTFVPAAAATATTVDSASTPAASTTAVPTASGSAQVASLRNFLVAFMEAFKTAFTAMRNADVDATVNSGSSEPLALVSASADLPESTSLAVRQISRRAVSLKTFNHHYRVGQATH
ncbi:unnamed protein product [Peniophora sp. CBMAI 1063]|nr:unnamed protein product [Peniophora sp. CBMAI 1063]